VDELNLNAILMIGAGCARLQRLTIAYCHYTVEDNDRRRLEAAVEAAKTNSNAVGRPFQQGCGSAFISSGSVSNILG
jgi:hypothetical protein